MRRELKGNWALIARVVAIAFSLFQLYTAAFGPLLDMQHRAVHVAFAFVLTFMVFSHRKRGQAETKVPVWDIAFIALVLVACANTYINWHRFIIEIGVSTPLDLILGVVIVILALETGRRTVGWAFPILTAVMLLYAIFGYLLPGRFHHRGFEISHILQYLNQTTYAIWGSITGMSATVLAIFIILGSFLLFSGGGRTFIDIALRVAGRFRGGPAMVAVVASSAFGTISGAAVANVLTTGSFTIPLMKRLGYRPEFAGGVEAAASTGGQIMPPIMGIGAFIMAEILGIPYLKVAVAAIIPALLYYVALLVSTRLQALRMGLPAVPPEQIPSARGILTWARLAPLVIPIVLLVGLLAKGYTITLAGFWACASTVIVFLFSDFSLSGMKHRAFEVVHGLERGGKTLIEIVSVIVCASILIGLVNLTGIGVKLSDLIMQAGGQSIFPSLVMAAIVALVLGMGMPTVGAYLLSAVVAAPALIKLGLMPLVAHLFVFYYAILAQITPPICVAVYAAAPICGARWPAIAVVAMKLAVVAYLMPLFFAYEPALLMMGSPLDIAEATITAIIGAICLGAGLMGYLVNKLGLLSRLALVPAGVLLLWAGWRSDLMGLALLLLVLLGERIVRRIPLPGRART